MKKENNTKNLIAQQGRKRSQSDCTTSYNQNFGTKAGCARSTPFRPIKNSNILSGDQEIDLKTSYKDEFIARKDNGTIRSQLIKPKGGNFNLDDDLRSPSGNIDHSKVSQHWKHIDLERKVNKELVIKTKCPASGIKPGMTMNEENGHKFYAVKS